MVVEIFGRITLKLFTENVGQIIWEKFRNGSFKATANLIKTSVKFREFVFLLMSVFLIKTSICVFLRPGGSFLLTKSFEGVILMKS